MPWKLVLFLICLVITTIFIGFNLDNTCTVNLIFTTFTDAPVFIVVLSSTIVGSLISAFFMVGMKFSNKKKGVSKSKNDVPVEVNPVSNSKNYSERINLQDSPISNGKNVEYVVGESNTDVHNV